MSRPWPRHLSSSPPNRPPPPSGALDFPPFDWLDRARSSQSKGGKSSAPLGGGGRFGGDDDKCLGQGRLIRQGHVDPGAHPRRRHRFEPRGRPAGQHQGRPAARQIDHAKIPPIDAPAEPGAERLGAGLLGGEALGIAGDSVGARVGTLALDGGKDAFEEALAIALDGALDPPDVDEIAAEAEDHQALRAPWLSARALFINARMRFTALSRPLKIASPTRKWPMLSSTIVGMAAIAPTVSKPRPWPAWHSSPRPSASAAAASMRRSSRSRAVPSASQ